MELDPILARIWPGRQAVAEPLGGGITNHNFKVTLDDGAYVLRIGGKDTQYLGIDRRAEYEATIAAAVVGVGPEVVEFVEPEGFLVTRFIEGDPILPEEMRRRENVRKAAEALRSFHEGTAIPGRFDSFRVVEAFHATASSCGVPVPKAYVRARETATVIEIARAGRVPRPCHNDLLNANFIDDGRAIRIVDWEYAGMGDVFFDLANLSVTHEFSPEVDEILLEAYFSAPTDRDRASLAVMRFMSDFREAMWGVVQQAISELDFDFVAYADDHFERLARTAGEEGFRLALHSLRARGAG